MFTTVLTQVIVLLILISIGVVLTKAEILTEAGVKSCTDIALFIVTPCVIIKSFIRKFDKATFKALLLSFLIAFCVHIGFIIISRILFRSKDMARNRVMRFGVVFTNCGFMSIPLQEAVLGETGVFYGSSFIAIFNVFVWSYGIISISGDKKYLSPKKLILNPGIIGLAVGLVIFLLSVPLPTVVSAPVSYLAAMNTPLPMLIIGYHLAQTNLIKAFKDLQCIFAVAVRLILLPLLSLFVMYICGVRGTMLVSCVISCSAPTAAITTMFSHKFSADTPLSVNMVSLTTVLSLITMPAIITLAQYLA